MTKKSHASRRRRSLGFPSKDDVASIMIDRENSRFIFTTKSMLVNQIHRDGPRIAKSFDRLTKAHVEECSEVFGRVQGMLVRHLPRLDDDRFKATSARLLATAVNAYVASIEVARHGYRRQYGVLARAFIETLATVITLAIRPEALDQFHEGKLLSTKCVSWSKAALPPLGVYYGMLSNEFTHVTRAHAVLEPPSLYRADDEALPFIIMSTRGNAWLLYVVAELIYHDEVSEPQFWFGEGGGRVAYRPTEEAREWSNSFLAMLSSSAD